jgi:hypothetical protein
VSRDLVIYARSGEIVPSTDLVATLESIGVPAEWQHMAPRRADRAGWTRGLLLLSGRINPRDRVEVSNNPLSQGDREYLGRLPDTGSHRKALALAQRQYFLSVTSPARPDLERALAALAIFLADRTDGVIHDGSALGYYTSGEFAAERRRIDP